MLTELCQELRNWFEREKYFDVFTIRDGMIYRRKDTEEIKFQDNLTFPDGAIYFTSEPLPLLTGQYYRIIGSVFNDGIHRHGDEDLQAETFDGAVWALAIPKPVINLATEIEAWRNKYEAADSPAMSPFTSESFGGYSYSKGTSNSAAGGSTVSWKTAFASRMNAWRKL